MLLISWVPLRLYVLPNVRAWLPCLALLLSLAPHARAQELQPPCIVDVPVYGPSGDPLPFKVVSVSPADGNTTNLLSVRRAGISTKNSDHTIFVSSKKLVGSPIQVTLQDGKGLTISARFVVTSCRLRHSIFQGESETGADVSGIEVAGRLAGCNFEGDWWVHAVPMFGGRNSSVFAVEGYVQNDGTFSLVLENYGVRHLLVVGKGKQPIKALGFDVTSGRATNLGVIDISGACPKP
jgi:hypothetical protein